MSENNSKPSVVSIDGMFFKSEVIEKAKRELMTMVVTNVGLMIISEIQKYVTGSNHDVQTSRGHVDTYLRQLQKANTISGYSVMMVSRTTKGGGEIQVSFTIDAHGNSTSALFKVPEPRTMTTTVNGYKQTTIAQPAKTKKVSTPTASNPDNSSDAYERAMNIFK